MGSRPDPLRILAVCGVGVGTSAILTMTIQAALRKLGITAEVSHTDAASLEPGMADVLVGHHLHVDGLDVSAPVTVTVDDFLDDDVLAARMRSALGEQGWL